MASKKSMKSSSGLSFRKDGVNRKPIHKEHHGRNELCPCGSGKKYKKCCETKKDSIWKTIKAMFVGYRAGDE